MVTKDSGKITFSYTSDALFNDVSLLSSYMTKNVVIEGGSGMDEFIISEDERDVFNMCVEQAIPDIYDIMLKITNGVGNAFDDKKISFSIVDNAAYNDNVLTLVDATVRDCMKYGILAEFYSINPNANLLNLVKNKHAAYLHLLNARLFQLKKKGISSYLG